MDGRRTPSMPEEERYLEYLAQVNILDCRGAFRYRAAREQRQRRRWKRLCRLLFILLACVYVFRQLRG